MPWIFNDWWQTSRFTRIATFVGCRDNVNVILSLQQNQIYLLQKKWRRKKGELGVVEFGEIGRYEETPTTIKLSDDYSRHVRELVITESGIIVDAESGLPEDSAYVKKEDYSLVGWILSKA